MSDKKGIQYLNVLVIDDDKDILELMKGIMKKLGFNRIIVCEDAVQALKMISENDVDLIICDWRMPGMSGVEFTRHVRNMPISKNTFLDIIMLTGNAEAKNIIEARDAGVTEYLIKPFSVKDLCSKIFEVVEKPREFIISENYKGPSRRRKNGAGPDGIERRKTKT